MGGLCNHQIDIDENPFREYPLKDPDRINHQKMMCVEHDPKINLLCGVRASAELLPFQFLAITAQVSCKKSKDKHMQWCE